MASAAPSKLGREQSRTSVALTSSSSIGSYAGARASVRLLSWTAKVVSYDVITEAGNKPHAAFVIEVTVSTEHFVVKHRYSAFKKLHDELVRMFPRVKLPTLPPARTFGRSLEDGYLRKQQSKLDVYLRALVELPTIAQSNIFIEFLANSEGAEKTLPPAKTAVGVLLQVEEFKPVDVKAGSEARVSFDVPDAGHVVLWEFKTKSYDIGFSVDFEGHIVVGHQRCDSHLGLVQGSYTAEHKGQCSLVFDNTYSRMRNKRVQLRHSVVDASAAMAGAAAEEAAKAKMRSQRTLAHLLKPRTVDSEVATQDESMVARAHRDQALSELEKVTEANAALNEQVKTLTEALESLRQEHGTAAEQLRNTKAELSSARDDLLHTRDMAERLADEKAAWAATRQRLADARQEAEAKAAKLKKERDDALLQVQLNKQSISTAMRDKDGAMLQRDDLEKQLRTLKRRLSQSANSDRLVSLEEEVSALKQQLAAATAETSKAKRAVAAVLKAQKTSDAKITKLKAQKKLLVSEVRALRGGGGAKAGHAASNGLGGTQDTGSVVSEPRRTRPVAVPYGTGSASVSAKLGLSSNTDPTTGRQISRGGSVASSSVVSAESPGRNNSRALIAAAASIHSAPQRQGTPPPQPPQPQRVVRAAESHLHPAQRGGGAISSPGGGASYGSSVSSGGASAGGMSPTEHAVATAAAREQGGRYDPSFLVGQGWGSGGYPGSSRSPPSTRVAGAAAAGSQRRQSQPSIRSPQLAPGPMRGGGGAALHGHARGGAPAGGVAGRGHRFWRLEPMFIGGDPSKVASVQAWGRPTLHGDRMVDQRRQVSPAGPRGGAPHGTAGRRHSYHPGMGPRPTSPASVGGAPRGGPRAMTHVISFVSGPLPSQPPFRLEAAGSPATGGRAGVGIGGGGAAGGRGGGGASVKSKAGSMWGNLTSSLKAAVSEIASDGSASKKVYKFNVWCSNCKKGPLRFVHWRCAVCPRHSLCNDCYQRGAHGCEPVVQQIVARLRQQASARSGSAQASPTPPSDPRRGPPSTGEVRSAPPPGDRGGGSRGGDAAGVGGGDGGSRPPPRAADEGGGVVTGHVDDTQRVQ